MDTLYFLLSLIAFAWLALWSARGASTTDKFWWPFDIKAQRGVAAATAGDASRPDSHTAAASRGWRERVAHRDSAPRPATSTRNGTERRGPRHVG